MLITIFYELPISIIHKTEKNENQGEICYDRMNVYIVKNNENVQYIYVYKKIFPKIKVLTAVVINRYD